MIRIIKKSLAVFMSIATVFTLFTVSASAATVKNDKHYTSTAIHSLVTAPLSISGITSDVVPKGTIGTLPYGNSLIFWINASGGSGSYQYQIVVAHLNQKGDGSGQVEYISPYSSSNVAIYQPKQLGYYTVSVNVIDTNTGVTVRTLYMPTGLYGTDFIDVE